MDWVKSGEVFSQLGKQFKNNNTADAAKSLLSFSKKIYELYPLKELESERINDIAGFLGSLYGFMTDFDKESAKIKVFNPSLEEHGWEHRHTQVFILQQDMAFLVDSVLMALAERNYGIHNVKSTQFDVYRNETGMQLSQAKQKTVQPTKETLIFIQIDHLSSIGEHSEIERVLHELLDDVRVVTDDFLPTVAKVDEIIAEVTLNYADWPDDQLQENIAFLQWLKDEHFTFLAYAAYELISNGDPVLHHIEEQRLGLFKRKTRDIPDQNLSELVPGFLEFYQNNQLLILTKSPSRSHIHRDAYCDYVVIKRFGEDGRLIGEHRFLGLYTGRVYTESPFSIPIIRKKLQQVYARSELDPIGHDGKNLRQIMETYPRDELFHGSEEQLFNILIGVWQIKERKKVKLFIRPDLFEKFVSCVVYFPRDTYHTDIRLKTEQFLMKELDASASQFTTYFGESTLARTHFVLRINSDKYKQVDYQYLEEQIVQLTRNWVDDLEHAILDHWGDEAGLTFWKGFKSAFPVSYQEYFDPRTAVHDMQLFLKLEQADQIAMSFYQPKDAAHNCMKFKLFHNDVALQLSDLVPMLENLGFRVVGEHPYEIKPTGGPVTWMHEFTLQFGLSVDVDVSAVRQHFQDAFEAVWLKKVDDDAFNRLIVGARLDWQSVALLRLYARYMKQLGLPLSQAFIASTLAAYPEISRNLIALFKTCFDPKLVAQEGEKGERSQRLEKKILQSLDSISNLNEDQVLRSYLQLVCATLRTNFFQRDEQGKPKSYVSIKLAPKRVAMVPEPKPEYEIFVYSTRVEGLHLRTGKIARGGLRWSDRLEDYRTEVLGLVKAQQVKNAVIVPAGAKGGFVAKNMPTNVPKEAILAEGIACYKIFIAGLLDVTDNWCGGKVIPPTDVIRQDGDDSYLVVAADKGTARFSDIANQMAENYHYWLDDAFASGGSHGYDHKQMGITARGAWVAVQRHFLEFDIDIQNHDFTVVGIGDMAGDVFGNGMLLSKHIKLVAAFNHEAIFLDPSPNREESFFERERLFQMPGSSWFDYNEELISMGGGVFSRGVKAIPISPQVQSLLQITENNLTPAQLIKAILSSQVDLIWNGGIGTYVKSRSESQLDVGDRLNDDVRVTGKQLRCRVFGEGGNLGMTQLGRIEFALNGGACNTDFIDNAGGVDCSDIEVNIKIALNQLVDNEDLTRKQRNIMLEDMTNAVTEMVLKHNYRQTQGISLALLQCSQNTSQYWQCLRDWEQQGLLNRALEFLPSEEDIIEREKAGKVLTRPELAVLASHAKIIIKEALADSEAIKDQTIAKGLDSAFPAALVERYPKQLSQHILRSEIIANQIANEMVDLMGLSFVHRQRKSTGASTGDVVYGYVITRDILRLTSAWEDVEQHRDQLSAEQQLGLLSILMRLGRRTTRWMVRNRRSCGDVQGEIEAFHPLVIRVLDIHSGDNIITDDEYTLLQTYRTLGLAEETAKLLTFANNLFFTMGIADVSIRTGMDVDTVDKVYKAIDEQLHIHWFAEQIVMIEVTSRWEDHAREAFIDELEHQFRTLATTILKDVESPMDTALHLEGWQQSQAVLIQRWQGMIQELRSTSVRDFALFSVALRELLDLVSATTNIDQLDYICSIDKA